ncbi:hypothetical protein SPRG_00595 [Saprolegnia parasitica CBS 223.65]|uniref:F-box/LRR-repeat protein 15-like leucin rich repeat domain-containing protein n=1 Tax=Saprolegnia parasitica (strain CBS 223.65) TaxID=695850 RepID=A0A067D692_SAPPC|nr:hypothetical protein SPRG_00595 [Saprolegnia parasitica CBS 223.65]KDO34532.1 hypothetical protein SPRG_00595 [Saprolegnia parasitica CBS 223.65]|eukprot:XP_012194210.1 hypothetical protein SPRG_00595 [Saprolegnia parasitica CBS 223.65]
MAQWRPDIFSATAKAPQHCVLDLLCRKEIVYGKALSMEPVLCRVAAFLNAEYCIGHDTTRMALATILMQLSTKHYKLVRKNPYFFRALVVRRPSVAKVAKLHEHLRSASNRIEYEASTPHLELYGPTLQALDVSFCHEVIDDAALASIASQCPRLRHVVLWACHQLTDRGLMALATHCRYLDFLNFGGCRHVTDVALDAIGQELLYLDNLHLSGCKNVSDAGIAVLATYSRVLLQLTPADAASFRVPQEFDLHHMKTQLRKFDCKRVAYREAAPGDHELVLSFGSRPKAVGLWCTLDSKGRQSNASRSRCSTSRAATASRTPAFKSSGTTTSS